MRKVLAMVAFAAVVSASVPATADPFDLGEGTQDAGRTLAQGFCSAVGAKYGAAGGAAIGPLVCGKAFDRLNEAVESIFDAYGEWRYGPLWPESLDQFKRIERNPPIKVEPQS